MQYIKITNWEKTQHYSKRTPPWIRLYVEILDKYDTVMKGFEEVVLGNTTLEQLGIEKAKAKKLAEIVMQRVKPPEVIVKGELELVSFAPDGVELVKKALLKAEDAVKGKDAIIRYKGAGKFLVEVKDNNYKDAEETLSLLTGTAIKEMPGAFLV